MVQWMLQYGSICPQKHYFKGEYFPNTVLYRVIIWWLTECLQIPNVELCGVCVPPCTSI